jgi:hypothetical protein
VCNETTNAENFHRMHTGENQEQRVLSLARVHSISLFKKATAIPFNRRMVKKRKFSLAIESIVCVCQEIGEDRGGDGRTNEEKNVHV